MSAEFDYKTTVMAVRVYYIGRSIHKPRLTSPGHAKCVSSLVPAAWKFCIKI